MDGLHVELSANALVPAGAGQAADDRPIYPPGFESLRIVVFRTGVESLVKPDKGARA